MQPTYLESTIVLFDGAVPTLNWDEEAGNYYEYVYVSVNFPSGIETYYFEGEASTPTTPYFLTVFFMVDGAGNGFGLWITACTKFSGVEKAGYYISGAWIGPKVGEHTVRIGFRSDAVNVQGDIKIMVKWLVPPAVKYSVELTSVSCQGVGEPIMVEGRISPQVGMKRVTVYFTTPTGRIENRSQYTLADGSFKLTREYIAEEPGKYSVYAQVDDAVSDTVQITVPEVPVTNRTLGLALTALGVTLILIASVKKSPQPALK